MSVSVVCPSCKSSLKAPRELLGRKVKCPDCGLVLVVPAVAYPTAPPAPPKPAPPPRSTARPAPRPQPLPDDDDDDRPPRRRKSSGGLLLVFGGLFVLLLLGGASIATIIYLRENKLDTLATDTGGGGGKPTIPAGWELFNPPGAGFRVYMPDIPTESSIPGGVTSDLRVLGGDARMYQWIEKNDGSAIFIAYIRFPESQPKSKRDSIVAGMVDSFKSGSGGRELSRRSVRMAGRDAEEIVIEASDKSGKRPQIVCRVLVTPTTAYLLIIGSENGRPKAAEERAFFDSFELTGTVSTPAIKK